MEQGYFQFARFTVQLLVVGDSLSFGRSLRWFRFLYLRFSTFSDLEQ